MKYNIQTDNFTTALKLLSEQYAVDVGQNLGKTSIVCRNGFRITITSPTAKSLERLKKREASIQKKFEKERTVGTREVIMASQHIGNGFPPEEGIKLADYVLQRRTFNGAISFTNLKINVISLPAALLISGFFNGFLQRIHDKSERALSRLVLDEARKIEWFTNFDFQQENIKRWMKEFQPYYPIVTGDCKEMSGKA